MEARLKSGIWVKALIRRCDLAAIGVAPVGIVAPVTISFQLLNVMVFLPLLLTESVGYRAGSSTFNDGFLDAAPAAGA